MQSIHIPKSKYLYTNKLPISLSDELKLNRFLFKHETIKSVASNSCSKPLF